MTISAAPCSMSGYPRAGLKIRRGTTQASEMCRMESDSEDDKAGKAEDWSARDFIDLLPQLTSPQGCPYRTSHLRPDETAKVHTVTTMPLQYYLL